MSSSVASIAQWQKRVGDLLPSLSKSEARVLGLLSYGIVILDGCGITRLSHGLAQIEQVPAGRLRQRLREFYYEAQAKRGHKRREVEVERCFGDLLHGILRGWEGKKELALDARCQHTARALYRAQYQRGVPGMRDTSCLEAHPSSGRGGVARALGGDARAVIWRGAKGVEGHRDGRPRTLRSLALSGHCRAGMASLSAGQRRPQFSRIR